MKININKYRGNYHWIRSIFERERAKKGYDFLKTATELSAVSHVPLIAILCFYGEYYGFNKDIIDRIDQLSKFYGYSDIEGYEQ